jgi:hypothetical protein
MFKSGLKRTWCFSACSFHPETLGKRGEIR